MSTKYISKTLITSSDEINATFRGAQVVSFSLEPKGVVRAQINLNSGIVTFEKYESDWYGEIVLNLQTESSEDEQFMYDFNVKFESEGSETEYSEEYDYKDVEILSNEEIDDIDGGVAAKNAGSTVKKGKYYTYYYDESKTLRTTSLNWIKAFRIKGTIVQFDITGKKFASAKKSGKYIYVKRINNSGTGFVNVFVQSKFNNFIYEYQISFNFPYAAV